MGNVLVAGPEVEPVSLQELKAFARIGGTNEDELLESLGKTARVWCETYISRALIEQTWRATFSWAPCGRMLVLPRGPLLRVSSMTFYDDRDEPNLWDIGNVFVDTQTVPGRLVLREWSIWPFFSGYAQRMVVDYVAGYGASAQDVPEDIKTAVKQLALHWHENRNASSSRPDALGVPACVVELLRPYRLYGVGGACV